MSKDKNGWLVIVAMTQLELMGKNGPNWLISNLNASGFETVITTPSHYDYYPAQILEAAGLAIDQHPPIKIHAEAKDAKYLLNLAKQNSIVPQRCILLEDWPNEIKAGQSIGMKTIKIALLKTSIGKILDEPYIFTVARNMRSKKSYQGKLDLLFDLILSISRGNDAQHKAIPQDQPING